MHEGTGRFPKSRNDEPSCYSKASSHGAEKPGYYVIVRPDCARGDTSGALESRAREVVPPGGRSSARPGGKRRVLRLVAPPVLQNEMHGLRGRGGSHKLDAVENHYAPWGKPTTEPRAQRIYGDSRASKASLGMAPRNPSTISPLSNTLNAGMDVT